MRHVHVMFLKSYLAALWQNMFWKSSYKKHLFINWKLNSYQRKKIIVPGKFVSDDFYKKKYMIDSDIIHVIFHWTSYKI